MAGSSDRPSVLDDAEAVLVHVMDELARQRRRLDDGSLYDRLAAIRKAAECVRLIDELALFVAAMRGHAESPAPEPEPEPPRSALLGDDTAAPQWGSIR